MAPRPGDRYLIKEWNEGLVLDIIRRHEPVTRVEIAAITGLGRSTITVITGRLISQGLLLEVGSIASGEAGRRPVLLRLQAQARSVVGLKLGPDSIEAATLDLHAEVRHRLSLPLPEGGDPDAVIQALAEATRRVISQSPPNLGRCIGVGLVMPGVIEAATGRSANPYYSAWADMPFRTRLEELLSLPVLTDNDANAAALAEWRHGAGKGCDNLLCLTVGVGIGSGMILGGRLHRGLRSGAGEIGHTLVDPAGPLCRCGRRGCLEAVASDPGLAVRTGRSRADLVLAARSGDQSAAAILAEAGRTIGVALANAVNLISPERVVVTGEAALEAGELLLAPMRQAVREHAYPVLVPLEIVLGQLGTQAWVKGAAALVLEDAFRVPLERSQSGEGDRPWSGTAASARR